MPSVRFGTDSAMTPTSRPLLRIMLDDRVTTISKFLCESPLHRRKELSTSNDLGHDGECNAPALRPNGLQTCVNFRFLSSPLEAESIKIRVLLRTANAKSVIRLTRIPSPKYCSAPTFLCSRDKGLDPTVVSPAAIWAKVFRLCLSVDHAPPTIERWETMARVEKTTGR
jgi:hypothetical protein